MSQHGKRMVIEINESIKDGKLDWEINEIKSFRDAYRYASTSVTLKASGRPLQVMKRLVDYLYAYGEWKPEDGQITMLIEYGIEKKYWSPSRIEFTPLAMLLRGKMEKDVNGRSNSP